MKKTPKNAAFLFVFLILPLILSCAETKPPEKIKEARRISACTWNDARSYYSSAVNSIDFENDLVRTRLRNLGVTYKVVTPSWHELTEAFNFEQADVIGENILPLSSMTDRADSFDLDVFDHADVRNFNIRVKSKLPKYTEIIQETAGEYDLDWRFIAALIYQESHFDPMAKGDAGVEGLMQLTLDTALQMGIENRRDPVQNITAGIKYFDMLYKIFDQAENPDRLLITLASYNAGPGHIFDARKIARERNLDPNCWDDLEKILPLLRYPEYYNKATHGYCRGTEPVRYVKRIWSYYDLLKNEGRYRDIYELES
jgi:membrane-bound lytic murein transglycosylase MltF